MSPELSSPSLAASEEVEACTFCRIAAHRAAASIILEEAATLAFLDIHPLAQGHTLVIPRVHCRDLLGLDDLAGAAVIKTVRRVAQALQQELRPDGINLLQSNGRAAGQTVFHFHFHIVPRWNHDGLFLPHHPPSQAQRSELDAFAARLSAQL